MKFYVVLLLSVSYLDDILFVSGSPEEHAAHGPCYRTFSFELIIVITPLVISAGW